MKIDVSRHREWIEAAVAAGEFASAEEAVDAALTQIEHDRRASLEEMTGLTGAQLREEVRKGLSGPMEVWEGADSFIARMWAKQGR